MEILLRNIDKETWQDFKKLCLEEKVSCVGKVRELITQTVTTYRKNERRRLQKRLDELGQK